MHAPRLALVLAGSRAHTATLTLDRHAIHALKRDAVAGRLQLALQQEHNLQERQLACVCMRVCTLRSGGEDVARRGQHSAGNGKAQARQQQRLVAH